MIKISVPATAGELVIKCSLKQVRNMIHFKGKVHSILRHRPVPSKYRASISAHGRIQEVGLIGWT